MANRFLSNIKINDAYTFPASDGTNGQVIKTDGSGNLSFAQLAADSASVMYKDTFTGNGSATAFTLANALNDEVQSNVYIDGVYQSKSTYSVSGTTLTFSTAPASGHEIEVISTTGINSGPTAIYTDTFTANGSATAFTLGQTVHDENQTIVFLNGVYQFKGTYTLSGTTLTLDAAPANGVAIEVMSIGSAYSGGDILYDHDFGSAGLMTTNGSGVYSITANNSANWNTAYGWGDHSTQSYATQSYVGTQISNLVDSSPATLNTLNELAAALGDDPNFATTTANSIGTKLPLAGGTLTGGLTGTTANFSGNVTIGTGIIKPNIGGDIAITQGAIGLRINDAASALSPTTATSNNDNAVDLGVSNIRFRNLYMGGNGTFGGSITISSSTATLNLTGSNTGASLINFADSDDGNVGRIYYDHTSNFMQFKTNDSEKLRIDSSGRVGIGITPSLADVKLHTYNNSTSAYNIFESSANKWVFGEAGGVCQVGGKYGTHAGIQINTVGYVGIGETSPLGKLHVKTTDTASTANSAGNLLVLEDSENGMSILSSTSGAGYILFGDSGDNDIGGILYDHSANAMRFKTNGVWDRMRIDSSGNVGIGTASLTEKLRVQGNSGSDLLVRFQPFTNNAQTKLYLSSVSSGDGGYFYDANNNQSGLFAYGDYTFYVGTSNISGSIGNPRMIIKQGGNVGIGTTSPDYQLDIENSSHAVLRLHAGVNSSASLRLKNDAQDWDLNTQTTDTFAIYNQTSGTQPFSILTNGNVGIGTTSPSAKLEVKEGHTILGGTQNNYSANVFTTKLAGYGVLSTGTDRYGSYGWLTFNSNNNYTGAARAFAFTNGYKANEFALLMGTSDQAVPTLGAQGEVTNGQLIYHVNNSASFLFGKVAGDGNGPHLQVNSYGYSSTFQGSSTANMVTYKTGTELNTNVGALVFRDNGNDYCGQITVNGATNTTSYLSASDYRLKEDLKSFDGMSLLEQIQVYDFKWKKENVRTFGVLAHELKEVLPLVVDGDKDEEKYQTVDYSKIVPVLIKAIQELKADNDSLKARIETLENN